MPAKYRTLGHAPQMSVAVSTDTIGSAIERSSSHCMVADAIKAHNPKLKHVAVDIQTIRATDPAKRERYVWLTPRSVQKAIIDFDQGVRPKAWSFTLKSGQTTTSATGLGIGAGKKKRRHPKAKMRTAKGGNARTVPVIVGGREPPVAAGRRREFGLRAFVR